MYSQVAILAGAAALTVRAEVLAVVAVLGAPIVKSLPGKHVFPNDSGVHHQWAGSDRVIAAWRRTPDRSRRAAPRDGRRHAPSATAGNAPRTTITRGPT